MLHWLAEIHWGAFFSGAITTVVVELIIALALVGYAASIDTPP
jgi:hypothetical protein